MKRDAELAERARHRRMCLRHLKDLRAAHARPPADIIPRVNDERGLIRPPEPNSGCSSPFSWL